MISYFAELADSVLRLARRFCAPPRRLCALGISAQLGKLPEIDGASLEVQSSG